MNIYKFITQKTHIINLSSHLFSTKNQPSNMFTSFEYNNSCERNRLAACYLQILHQKRSSVCMIVDKIPLVISKYAISLSIFAETHRLCLRLVYWEQGI